MHLIALVEKPGHVCCRYRLSAFRAHFEAAGHTLELQPRPRHWWSWLLLGRVLGRTDAVLLQRRLLANWQLALLRRAARVLLYDFDDAVFLRDSYAPRGPHSARRLRRFVATVRAADAVIAGNAFLADQAARWTSGRRIHIVPTCVEPDQYPLAVHRADLSLASDNPVQLVWVGSPSTLSGLEKIRPLLENLGQALPQLRLRLICSRFLEFEHLPVHRCTWSEATEAAEIASGDIGISWVPDDAWSRGKCGLKVLQYMAAGLPVIANPVGVHTELVRPGETGCLAATPAEWLHAVKTLADQPGLRQRMGEAGRRLVESAYSVRSGAVLWNGLLDRLQLRRALSA